MGFVRLTKKGECCICDEPSWAYINSLYFCAAHHEEGENFLLNKIVGDLEYNSYAKMRVKMAGVK